MRLCRLLMPVVCSMLVPLVPVEGQSINKSWYVSKAQSSVPGDGRSWKSAWQELSEIRWDNVKPGDTIFIDGGKTSTTYTSPLRIQKNGTKAARITIKQSTEAGHNGQVVIHGPNIGIAIQNQSFISVIGARWSGIVVDGCPDAGISVYGSGNDYMAVSNVLQNIEVRNCGLGTDPFRAGVVFGGHQLTLNQVIVHDNYYCNLRAMFSQDLAAVENVLNVKRCWIYNRTVRSDGFELRPGGSFGPKMVMSDCILGPGLVRSAQIAGQARLFVDGALFINGSASNLTTTVGSNLVDLRNTTSFLTRLNAEGNAHSFIDAPDKYEQVKINNSIVYGGTVLLKTGRVGNANTQFRTAGNTAALSDRMVDPRFSANVGAYPNNVSTGVLIATDYGLSPDSPAVGTGARITSVKQLLGGK